MQKDNTGPAKKLDKIQSYESHLAKLLEKASKNFPNQDVSYEVRENNKISDTLREFIEPYMEEVDGVQGLSMLVDFGALAWNLSFFSKKVAQQEIDHLLQEHDILSNPQEKADKEDFKNMLGQMIARKKRHFSKYKRLIVDYELKDEQDNYHLFVASIPISKRIK